VSEHLLLHACLVACFRIVSTFLGFDIGFYMGPVVHRSARKSLVYEEMCMVKTIERMSLIYVHIIWAIGGTASIWIRFLP